MCHITITSTGIPLLIRVENVLIVTESERSRTSCLFMDEIRQKNGSFQRPSLSLAKKSTSITKRRNEKHPGTGKKYVGVHHHQQITIIVHQKK
jgi:hypothetical protein